MNCLLFISIYIRAFYAKTKAALGIAADTPQQSEEYERKARPKPRLGVGEGNARKKHISLTQIRVKQLFFIVVFLFSLSLFAQEDAQDNTVVIDTVLTKKQVIDPLSPSRAAFYSAVLPGLGQAYNKKYWKIPIVYAALGTGMYFYVFNTNEYNRYRDAYKRRLAGFSDDEFQSLTNDALQDAQEFYQRNKDLSLLITVGLYVLNIIDANVDAHLKQYNISDDLTLNPVFQRNPVDFSIHSGISLTFNF